MNDLDDQQSFSENDFYETLQIPVTINNGANENEISDTAILSPTMKFLQQNPTFSNNDSSLNLNLLEDELTLSNLKDLDIWSKFNLSFTDVGINMEANVTNASDLHSLINAFSKLSSIVSPVMSHDTMPPGSPFSVSGDESSTTSSFFSNSSSVTVCKNKSHKLKPINYFASVNKLGEITEPHSAHDQLNLKQVADACIDTYFTCWVRTTPIMRREEFMEWYNKQEDPTSTLIVNALCVAAFRHTILHHSRPGLEHFIQDQDKIKEQEEFFFNKTRECLSRSFDNPDRFTIIALILLVHRADPSLRHHYSGMAVSALLELDIHPRTVEESEDETYEKEMDTRLWWFVWAWEFYLYTSGSLKSKPQHLVPGNEIDFPRIIEQDIDDDEIAVIAFVYLLRIWKIQAHFISTLYEQEYDMTWQQLQEYDNQLLAFYEELPEYFKFDSGFEYGHGDLFLACIRVNIEYNATRIILHKLFIPEVTDSRPSRSSLESLNICLKMALKQLPSMNSGILLPNGGCIIDRDELWRAGEIISTAMDVYRNCSSTEDQSLIIQDISINEFENGLTKIFDMLKKTVEYKVGYRNFIQVANWLEVEIQRHRLYANPRTKPKDIDEMTLKNKNLPNYFLANLKSDSKLKRKLGTADSNNNVNNELLFHRSTIQAMIENSQNRSNDTLRISNVKRLKFNSKHDVSSSNIENNSSLSPVQYTMESFNSSADAKNQPKFRYFNPKKMNKFMFIDDNPM